MNNKASKLYALPRIRVSHEQVEAVLSSGYYSGINYWAEDMIPMAEDARTSLEANCMKYGFGVRDASGETPSKRRVRWIKPARIKRAVQLMADKYPHHFADMMAGNGDQTTGDVLIQLAVFRDVIYG